MKSLHRRSVAEVELDTGARLEFATKRRRSLVARVQSKFRVLFTLFRCAAVGAALLTLAMFAHAQERDDAGVAPTTTVEPATLTLWNRDIVTLRARFNDLPPSTRVENAARRLELLPVDTKPDQVSVAPGNLAGNDGLFVTVDSQMIVALLPRDVDPESGLTLGEFGLQVSERVRELLRARSAQNSTAAILGGMGKAMAASIVFVVVLWLALRARRMVLARLEHRLEAGRRLLFGIDVRLYSIAIARGFAKLAVILFAFVAAHSWLSFVLLQFPYSSPWGERLGSLLRDEIHALATAALRAMPGLLTVALILALVRAASFGVSSFFQRVEAGDVQVSWLEPETAKATRRITVVLLWIFGISVAYPYIPGSSSDAFKGISVFTGLMLTLGSTGLVHQMMSGFVLVYSRAFKAGDYVRIGDVEGTVTTVGVLSTKIKTPRLEEITVPNSVATGDRITNFSRWAAGQGAMASTTLTIGYDAPWRQVHELLILAACRTGGIRHEPAPNVLQRALSDFYVEYELRVSLERPHERGTVLSALHANIQDAFNECGLQIMSPHFEAQPAEKVFVPRARWHEAPTRVGGADLAGEALK